jgi:hypothetical protein
MTTRVFPGASQQGSAQRRVEHATRSVIVQEQHAPSWFGEEALQGSLCGTEMLCRP